MGGAVTHKEADRLEALERRQLLDTPPEPEFDELVELAAAVCGVPISTIALIDERRQWFKAVVGLDSRETEREIAFCSHTIQQAEMLVVEDAECDARFARNPLVLGEPRIRFYAGIAINSPEGAPVGTLCVIDRQPRQLSAAQKTALEVLARQVNARMELRLRRLQMEEAVRAKEEMNRQLIASQERFQVFMDSSPFLSFVKGLDGRMIYYNRPYAERFGISLTDWLGKTDFDLFPIEDARIYRNHDLWVLRSGEMQVLKERSRESDGRPSLWQVYKFPFRSADGLSMLGCIAVDVTEVMAKEEKMARMEEELELLHKRMAEESFAMA